MKASLKLLILTGAIVIVWAGTRPAPTTQARPFHSPIVSPLATPTATPEPVKTHQSKSLEKKEQWHRTNRLWRLSEPPKMELKSSAAEAERESKTR